MKGGIREFFCPFQLKFLYWRGFKKAKFGVISEDFYPQGNLFPVLWMTAAC